MLVFIRKKFILEPLSSSDGKMHWRALHTANREREGANKASTFKVVGSHGRVPILNKEETPIYSPIAAMRPFTVPSQTRSVYPR